MTHTDDYQPIISVERSSLWDVDSRLAGQKVAIFYRSRTVVFKRGRYWSLPPSQRNPVHTFPTTSRPPSLSLLFCACYQYSVLISGPFKALTCLHIHTIKGRIIEDGTPVVKICAGLRHSTARAEKHQEHTSRNRDINTRTWPYRLGESQMR
jgi:hypothetical protein